MLARFSLRAVLSVVFTMAVASVEGADFRCPPGVSVVPLVVDGNVIVEPGGFCTGSGSQIKGNVIVLPEALGFLLNGGRVEGDIQSERPQLEVRLFDATVTGSVQIKQMGADATFAVCRSNILGNVTLEENAGSSSIGDDSPTGVCPLGERNLIQGAIKLVKNRATALNVVGNRVFGNLQGEENAGPFNIERNSVGQNLQLYKNIGPTTVNSNTIGEHLQCFDNGAIEGTGNVARGQKQGDCAAF